MNNETENWKLNKIDVSITCVWSRECRICSFRESNYQFFFLWGSMPPNPPHMIGVFGADSTLVSPVTLVLNVQLQKTPYLDKMNDDTEKQWSKIYIILDENRSLNTKETIQNKTKAAVKRATKNVQLVLQHCCKPSWIAMLRVLPPMFDPVLQEIRLQGLSSWVVKRATSLFNSFCSHVAKQIARFLLPVLPYLR